MTSKAAGAAMSAQAAASGTSAAEAAPAKPFAPTPSGATSQAAAAAKPQAEVAKAMDDALAAKAAPPPTAPAAKTAAAVEAPAAKTDTTKAAVKPATATAKVAAGETPAAVAAAEKSKPKAAESKAHNTSADITAPVSQGKAAALAQGSGATAATATTTAAAAPKAKAKAAPTSAAAVMIDGVKPVSAIERQAVTGSVLARGTGAQAEQAAPKAKAKAKAGAGSSATKAAGTAAKTPAPATAAGAYPAGRAQAAPATVLDIVTGVPQPVLESATNAPASQCPATSSAVGPAKAYATMAAPAIASVSGAVGADGKPLEVPKVGPAAVAVGRAVAAGAADAVKVQGGKAQAPINKRFQIVFVSGEVAPYSKTGGLGEAMDGLPVALAALGHRVMVVAPRYDQYKEAWDTSFWSSVTMAGKQESVHFFHTYKQKVDYVFADHPCFLERVDGLSNAKLYGPEWGKDFADNQARYAYFCKAALLAIKELPLGGFPYGDKVVVVANDWHTALVPMLIAAERQADPTQWRSTKTGFLCHNAVFQGRFIYEEGIAEVLGVPQEFVDSITFKMPLKVGKYNEKMRIVNSMAAGLRYADRALTVSPSYAKECATDPEKGVELEELFALGRCTGILNGVKEGVSPSEKNFVTKTKMLSTFTPQTVAEAKAALKAAYRQESGLPESDAPMMCFIGRLDAQKGYDLLLEALVEVLEDTEIQVVIVGAGRADLVKQTKAVEAKFPSKLFYAGWMGPERYAMLAGCDYTLLPSRWEPCGLVQMEAMRMGTLPIVAPTGGLKDTVEDGVNGLWCDAEMTVEAELDEESVASIARALRRAAELHKASPEKELRMMRGAMAAAAEFTWSNAALQYEAVFEELGTECVLEASGASMVTLEVDKQVC